MSETIEERYEKMPHWYSEVIEEARYGYDVIPSLDRMRRLLDDLMAEREKTKERAKELERKQATHEISAVYCTSSQELELTWKDLQTGKIEGLTVTVSPAKGEAIATIVPPCVYSPAVIKED